MGNRDRQFVERAIELALASEEEGNLPVGAVLTLEGEIIGEGQSSILEPEYDPGRHAEIVAIEEVATELWPRASEMTCYTTLEPCVMCAGTLLLHGVGRVVFGARDERGGAVCILDHLPPYYDEGGVYDWEGPVMPEECRPLYERAHEAFRGLPVGLDQWTRTEPDDPEHYRRRLERWAGENADGVSLPEARQTIERLAELLGPEEMTEVLPYAVEAFRRGGFLKDYRALERYAGAAGHPEVVTEVEETLRRELPDIWIRRALERGDVDGAVACWFESEAHPRARYVADELVEAAGEDVQLLISCRLSKVSYLIGRGTRRHYRKACTILRKLRDELRAAGESVFWQHVLDDLRREHSSKPAFLDELAGAGF